MTSATRQETRAYCERHGWNPITTGRACPRCFEDPPVIELHTWMNDGAPPEHRWSAAFFEFDLGVKVYTGRTQREAINELLDAHEQDNGEIRP